MVDAAEPRPSGSGPESLPLPHGRGSDLRRFLRWIPALLWLGLIFWLSSQPQLPRLPEPLWQTLLAKTAHFGEHAVLALVLLFGVGRRVRRSPAGATTNVVGARSPRPYSYLALTTHLPVFAMALLYAVSDEFHQSFVPNRSASGWDVLIDGAGALAALFVAARVR